MPNLSAVSCIPEMPTSGGGGGGGGVQENGRLARYSDTPKKALGPKADNLLNHHSKILQ